MLIRGRRGVRRCWRRDLSSEGGMMGFERSKFRSLLFLFCTLSVNGPLSPLFFGSRAVVLFKRVGNL